MNEAPRFNPAYLGKRSDILRLIPDSAHAVLDVGCSTGELGKAIKRKFGAMVVGIERSEAMATVAAEHLDRVLVGDAREVLHSGNLSSIGFDAIVFADVLEHLEDPWSTLKEAAGLLASGGVIIASIPNIRHIYTIFNLVFKGYWPYNDRGIHDRTHLRFFTRRNVIELFQGAGLTIESLTANYRIIERPHRINTHAARLAMPGIREFLAFQFLVRGYRPT